MGKRKVSAIPYVDVPIFGGRVYLATSRELFCERVSQLRNGHDVADDAENCDGMALEMHIDGLGFAVLVGVFVPGRIDILMHELSHATFMLMDYVGVETGHGSRETFCYMLQSLFNHFKGLLAPVESGEAK